MFMDGLLDKMTYLCKELFFEKIYIWELLELLFLQVGNEFWNTR